MKKARFNMSYEQLLSCNMGSLVPIGLTECLPGDMVSHNTSLLLRCSPMARPLMHRVQMRVHHFFVPHRIVWPGWGNFYTGGPTGEDATVAPFIRLTWSDGSPPTGTGVVGGLADHLGCPTGVNNLDVSALPFRGYQMVWNYFFRDQDLQTEATVATGNGQDTTTTMTLQNCAWEKDYLTIARPFPQKGPDISIPLGDTAPVLGIGVENGSSAGSGTTVWETGDSTANTFSHWTSGVSVRGLSNAAVGASNLPQVFADLSGASAITVNALREAMALQRMQETRMRYGSRYDEVVAQQFGVKIEDSRLQQPEYLGGGQATVQFSEVVQTANDDDDPVGQLYGHGIGAAKSNRYIKFIPEHGFVITLLSVRPRTVYMQGLPRHFWRPTKEDYFNPELVAIGQQQVRKKEV